MLAFLSTRIGRAISAVVGALAAFAGVYLMGGRAKALKVENEALKDSVEKQKDGRDAVASEKAETDGLSGSDIVDRLRSRDRDWRGL